MKQAARQLTPFSYQWWMREGRISEADGHPMAAAAAYGQAIEQATTDDQAQLARTLLKSIHVQE